MKFRISCSVFLCFCVLVMMGCATQYQAKSWFGGGYSDVRLDQNTFKVVFECNENTSEAMCDGHLFRRCAELTLNSGFDSFVMIDHISTVREQNLIIPGHYDTVVTGSGRNKTTTYVYQPGYTITNRCPLSTATIKMMKGPRPANTQNAFDAREIMTYAAGSQ